MKRICERGLNWFQLYNYKGDVRGCSWIQNGYIGNIQENTAQEIFYGEKANQIRECLVNEDYSICRVDACPYLMMNDVDNHMVEYEDLPEYPTELYLGFEEICNYTCTCCSVRHTMAQNKDIDIESYYRKIEERIAPLLPHVTKLSANGCGELFCSKHTLNILANWKPLAEPDKIEVALESNGSLFDEEHWKQIENLGQYNLRVAITVMSFDEPTYQYLSGTKLPITRVENNLKFIKSLREKGIVNYFEIATVVQEQNFLGIPAFVQKCLDEYQPDSIRLRPYQSWGAQSPLETWFTDIRNPEHPYYQTYKKVMQHPVLKHPTVHDQSGGMDAVNRLNLPYKADGLKFKILSELYTKPEDMIKRLEGYSLDKKVIIYGASAIGKMLADKVSEKGYSVKYMIDQFSEENNYKGIPIVGLEQAKEMDKDACVVVVPIVNDKGILKCLIDKQYDRVISIKDLVGDERVRNELKGLM